MIVHDGKEFQETTDFRTFVPLRAQESEKEPETDDVETEEESEEDVEVTEEDVTEEDSSEKKES